MQEGTVTTLKTMGTVNVHRRITMRTLTDAVAAIAASS
jgi:hypothetical protein